MNEYSDDDRTLLHSEQDLPLDYEECDTCGYDHAYEPEESHKAHLELEKNSLTFEEAKVFLASCTRTETRYGSFGDVDIIWFDKAGNRVAFGDSGRGCNEVWVGAQVFEGQQAAALVGFGKLKE